MTDADRAALALELHALLRAQLPADWSAQRLSDDHEALMTHGRRVRTYRDPDCERCVPLELRPWGRCRLDAG